jgi:hypothetical protein
MLPDFMKTSILALIITTMTLASFSTRKVETVEARSASAEEQFALRVITSFQLSSSAEYAALFPSLETFQRLMQENTAWYGRNIAAAQEDFAKQYRLRILPAVHESFEEVIRKGKEHKINWDQIEFIRIELSSKPSQTISVVPFNIVFSSGNKEYRIQIERALYVNGEWKTSQFVKLVDA